MKTDGQNEKLALASTEIVWAFDLGKGSIGEAVRQGTTFLHKASLLIPADFAETKTAANRRRMWRTRQAHKAREQWQFTHFRLLDFRLALRSCAFSPTMI